MGREALVGAGALVPKGMSIPPRHLAMGIPARVVRELTKEEIEYLRASNERYVERAQVFPVTGKGG